MYSQPPFIIDMHLDKQVNNAGSSGLHVDEQQLKALNIDPETWV